MRRRVKMRMESDPRRPPGMDVLLDSLQSARGALQAGLAVETAIMAESLHPEVRATGRRILGIWDDALEPGLEEKAQAMKKAVDGNPDALYALAKEMLGDDEVGGEMGAFAMALLCMQSIVSIKQHAIEPSSGPRESELLWMLETLGPSVVEAVGEDLELIAKKSPFKSVKKAARAVLESR
jgi:hypothetical protein